MMILISTVAAWAAIALQAVPVTSDRLPYLTKSESDFLAGETSGDRAFEHLRWYTHWHRPFASEGLMAAAEYTEKRAREYGLADVKLVKTPFSGIDWTPQRGELWLTEPATEKLCDIGSVQLSLLDRSRSADVTAEVVDAGSGTLAADYEGKNVQGKIVLGWGAPAAVMKEAVWTRGAAGIIVRPDPAVGFERPDTVRWLAIPEKSEDGKAATFAFGLSHRQGVALAARCAAGAVKVHAAVECTIGAGWLVRVEASIAGTDPSLPCVVMTGHLQEERFSANDDGSGCADTLECARALAKGIRDGALPRPRRTIRFWWTTEIQSEDQLFAEHPEVCATILCNVNQDMVGAHQQQDTMRVQNVTRLPWSRAHVLETVADDVVTFLIEGNTAQLAARQRGVAGFPFPIYAKLGTRDRFNARFVPYHANTDHQCFVAPPIGIPGITFTNWPDDYIHGTDDDLANIDATQLQRNALAAGTIAYAMARFDAKDAEMLQLRVMSQASRRFGADCETAFRLVAEAKDRGRALRDAMLQIDAAWQRESWTLETVAGVTGGDGESAKPLAALLAADRAAAHARLVAAAAGAAPAEFTPAEKELSSLTPRRVGSIADYQRRRPGLKAPSGLHALLVHEALCLCDAAVRRSTPLTGLQIFGMLAAQSAAAGPWYYGPVTPAQTLELLKSAAEAGLIEIGGK